MARALRVLLVFLVCGCELSTVPVDAGSPDGGLGDTGVDAGCTPPAGDPFGCEDQTTDPACPAHWVVGTVGQVTRADGSPVENARAQLCVRVHPDDRLVCLLPPATDADGRFAIVVPEELRCLTRAAMRALAPREPLASTYCPVEFPADNLPIVDLGAPYVLHSVEPADVPALGDPSAPRDVTFPGGIVLNLAPEDLPSTTDYEELSGAPVDVTATECFAGGEVFDGAYVFGSDLPLDPGAAITLPNDSGLAPGSLVDLYVLGGIETRLIDGSHVEEAELATFGTATVSPDGSALVGDFVETRFPYLSWLLWRAR